MVSFQWKYGKIMHNFNLVSSVKLFLKPELIMNRYQDLISAKD